MNDQIKIFCAYHKDAPIIKNEIIEPIQVGRELSDSVISEIIGDNTNDNISYKNNIYCELTATYWAWKNSQANYIGLAHYRRFFSFEKTSMIKSNSKKSKYFLSLLANTFGVGLKKNPTDTSMLESITDFSVFSNKANSFCKLLLTAITDKEYAIIALKPIFVSMSIKNFFSIKLGDFHIELLKKIVRERHSNYSDSLDIILKGNLLYPANMVVMERSVFDEYCSFLFDVLDNHIDYCQKENYYYNPFKERAFSRFSGYLGEIVTSVFICKQFKDKIHKVKLVNQIFYTS